MLVSQSVQEQLQCFLALQPLELIDYWCFKLGLKFLEDWSLPLLATGEPFLHQKHHLSCFLRPWQAFWPWLASLAACALVLSVKVISRNCLLLQTFDCGLDY